MINNSVVKVCEQQFIERLLENLAAAENAGGLQESDSLSELRKLTGNTLLRNELIAKYPLGKSLSVRITPKSGLFSKESQPIVLTGKVVIRLDRFVEKGSDEEPFFLAELHSILIKESDLANRSRYESILGLYSPTGWVEDVKAFILNNPPGSGWASNRVYPILIGPEITELVWDNNSDKLRKYIQYFCGLTLEERSRICKDQLQRAVLVQEFANLEKIANEKGFRIEFVKDIAKKMTTGDRDLVLRKVPGVGLVLKKRM